MACSLIDRHADVQYQCKSGSHHETALRQGHKCSLNGLGHERMTLNSWRKDKDVFFHTTSSTFFSNRSCLVAVEEQYGMTNIDGKAITNLRFSEGVDALAEEQQALEALVKSHD